MSKKIFCDECNKELSDIPNVDTNTLTVRGKHNTYKVYIHITDEACDNIDICFSCFNKLLKKAREE